jgi:hypothetical protein
VHAQRPAEGARRRAGDGHAVPLDRHVKIDRLAAPEEPVAHAATDRVRPHPALLRDRADAAKQRLNVPRNERVLICH